MHSFSANLFFTSLYSLIYICRNLHPWRPRPLCFINNNHKPSHHSQCQNALVQFIQIKKDLHLCRPLNFLIETRRLELLTSCMPCKKSRCCSFTNIDKSLILLTLLKFDFLNMGTIGRKLFKRSNSMNSRVNGQSIGLSLSSLLFPKCLFFVIQQYAFLS